MQAPMQAPTHGPRDDRLAGRVALVTGASRGIGAAVAERFAREGAHVVLLARTVGGLEEVDDRIRAAGGSATIIPQDLADLAKLDRIGPVLLERFGRLDIWVACAAHLGALSPLSHAEPKTVERTFTVGVLANHRLIRMLDPLLRRAEAGRAILVTDHTGHAPAAFWGGYAAAKSALETMARTWAVETARTPLRINLIDPGPVATALRELAFPGEDQSRLRQPADVAPAFVDLAAPDCARHGDLVKLHPA